MVLALRERRTDPGIWLAVGGSGPRVARAEGGEALATAAADAAGITAPWHVVWTHNNCEEMVTSQLRARGFHPFVPRIQSWARRSASQRAVQVPLFPGYLFLNDALDKARHVEVRKARGVVSVLGEGWDRPAIVPDTEMQAIQRIVRTGAPAFVHPYLREGRRVRISHGPLAGVEGILLRVRQDKGIVVVSVNMLQRSVAVEVDCSEVATA